MKLARTSYSWYAKGEVNTTESMVLKYNWKMFANTIKFRFHIYTCDLLYTLCPSIFVFIIKANVNSFEHIVTSWFMSYSIVINVSIQSIFRLDHSVVFYDVSLISSHTRHFKWKFSDINDVLCKYLTCSVEWTHFLLYFIRQCRFTNILTHLFHFEQIERVLHFRNLLNQRANCRRGWVTPWLNGDT